MNANNTNKIYKMISNPDFINSMVKADKNGIKDGQVTLSEMAKEFPTLGMNQVQKIFDRVWETGGKLKTADGKKYVSIKWLRDNNLMASYLAKKNDRSVLIAKSPTMGSPIVNCANVDPGVISDANALTQTDFFVQINTTGGAKWNVNPASHPSSTTPPALNIPNKYLAHAVDANASVRVWRLDASGNRIAGEVHTLAIDAATKRIIDPADTTGSIAAAYAQSQNSNANPNEGYYYKINYSEFVTAGPVYGVQFEMYYPTGPSNHPIMLSSYSPAIMNPSAPINKNANLDSAPLLLIERPSNTSTDVNYYLGVKEDFKMPAPDEYILVNFGSESMEARASSIFDYSKIVTDDSYQYNGRPIKKIKFNALNNFLNTHKGTVSFKLGNYSNKVTIKSTQLDTSSTKFSTGNVSNVNSASSDLNWNGVNNSGLWTVQVQTDASGVQYNEYTISAATWNTLAANYSIPVGQLRLLIVRGDGNKNSNDLATDYEKVGTGYKPDLPYSTVAQYEAAGFDVPVVRTTGAQYSSPTIGSATGEGAEISASGGTGPTVLRFKTSSTATNTIRQDNDGSIKVLIFQAGVPNPGPATNIGIHSINLSISSGETAQWEHQITEKE